MSQYVIYEHKDENRKAHNKAILLSENTKFKTVMLQFLDTMEVNEFSSSTFKRWWKKTDEFFEFPEEPVQEESVQEETPLEQFERVTSEVEEEVAGDGTPYSQVLAEILADEKKAVEKKVKKSSKRTKRATFDSTSLQEYCIEVVDGLGGDFVQRHQHYGKDDMAQKVFRAGGKMFCHMSYPRYYLRLDTRWVDTEELVPDAEITGFYSTRYLFTEDTKKVRSKIKKILTQAYKAQIAKNNKKGKGKK